VPKCASELDAVDLTVLPTLARDPGPGLAEHRADRNAVGLPWCD
jgi:hypothetical protein